MIKGKIEFILHLLFWTYLISAINVDWTTDWFDSSLRPRSPAPLSVIFFGLFFYVNAFILIPKYFSRDSWKKYLVYAFILFIIPEVVRIVIYKYAIVNESFEKTLFSRDSFLFGAPSPLFLALNISFIYRFIIDRFIKNKQSQNLEKTTDSKKASVPYEFTNILSEEEAKELQRKLMHQLNDEEVYLNPKLTLRELSESIGSTEKKVSYLLNQNLDTSYSELINRCRVEKFKNEVIKTENKSLSLVGLALNCGFPSKSSFYRAFKSEVSMSPSEYVKNL